MGDKSPNLKSKINWGLLLALALAIFAAAPFLTKPGLPRQTDAELHVYRAAELGHVLRAGAFYPRWAPDLYLGYGYPIFNYYAPLTYYLANLFDLLPGVDIVGGVKAVFVLGLIVASVGTYLLGRELFGPAAGVLAAASFTFAPYVVFIDPHTRGDLAEHFALCLLPLTFYAFRRLISGVGVDKPRRGALLGSVLTLAALVFSHNLLGLVSGGLLFVYWMWEVAFGVGRSRVGRRPVEATATTGWVLLAFALAAAIIAFFWFPALLEYSAVKLQVIGGHFDFRRHFVAPSELFAPSRIHDLGATGLRYQYNLGLAQWLLALPALGVLLRRRASPTPLARHSHTLLYFVLYALGLVFLILPASAAIWEHIPGMLYLQFPWRLLGPANLMLAVCAASGVTLLPAGRWRNPALATALAIILLLALPVLYPPEWTPDFGGTAPLDIIQWEWQSLAFGTTSTGDFLPVEAAQAGMVPMPSLVESYARPGPVDKVNRATLPDGAEVEIVEHGPLHDRFAVSTPKKFQLRLYTFYFQGWRAYLDDEETEIQVASPEGFITLWVPEGEHDVLVRFEDTPPRTAGWVISAAGLAALIVALALMRAPRRGRDAGPYGTVPHVHSPQSLIWLGGTLTLLVLFKSLVIDPQDNWLRYTSPPGQALAAQHELRANFDGKIELLGYDLPRRRVHSGDEFPITLYWHALTPLEANYKTFLHLARPLHVLWGQEDHANPGSLPTTRWPLDKYVWDEYKVSVLPGTPPGEYVINVGLYLEGGYRLQRYDEQGQVVGDSLALGSIEVTRPRRQPQMSDLDMTHEMSLGFPGGGVTLLGYDQSHDQSPALEPWSVTLFWRADRDHPPARRRDLLLLDNEGHEVMRYAHRERAGRSPVGARIAATTGGAPVDGYYPFESWQAGEIVRDQLIFAPAQLAQLEPGVYRFGLTVSADEPLKPQGRKSSFVPLGTIERLVEE